MLLAFKQLRKMPAVDPQQAFRIKYYRSAPYAPPF